MKPQSKASTRSRLRRAQVSQEDISKEYIRSEKDPGDSFLLLNIHDAIGLTVIADRDFAQGDFLLEYRGEKISQEEGKKRMLKYKYKNIGNFLFFGVKDMLDKNICIDATESSCLARYVNDSPDEVANAKMKRVVIKPDVYICLFAKTYIKKGTEIRYDYFDTEENMPWRNEEWLHKPLTLNEFKEIQLADSEEAFSFSRKEKIEVIEVLDNSQVEGHVSDSDEEIDSCKSVAVLSGIHTINIKKARQNNEISKSYVDEDFDPINRTSSQKAPVNNINNPTQKNESNADKVFDSDAINRTPLQKIPVNNINNTSRKKEINESNADKYFDSIHRTPSQKAPVNNINKPTQRNEINESNVDKVFDVDAINRTLLQKTPVNNINNTSRKKEINESNAHKVFDADAINGTPLQKSPVNNINNTSRKKEINEINADIDFDLVHRTPLQKAHVNNINSSSHKDFNESNADKDFDSIHRTPLPKTSVNNINKTSQNNEINESNADKNFDATHRTPLQIAPPVSASTGMHTPLNDSGLQIDNDMEIIDSEDEQQYPRKSKSKKKQGKPPRPCIYCNLKMQSRLKRHILTQHKDIPRVASILKMPKEEQEFATAQIRREGMLAYNIKTADKNGTDFQRERQSKNSDDAPIMCTGCKMFIANSYKARHNKVCSSNFPSVSISVASLASTAVIENQSIPFKELLSKLRMDEVGSCIKNDEILLMIGSRSFNALNRKQDKKIETTHSVRARMRLLARLYLAFTDLYKKQHEVQIEDSSNNSSDLYRRETILILGQAVNRLCDNSTNFDNEDCNHSARGSITKQKSGLKISILNHIKITAKFLIGYYLMKQQDAKSERVTDFIKVLKYYEDDIFGDALYDLNYRRNLTQKKPVNLPSDDDVKKLMDECISVIDSFDLYQFDISFVTLRSAVVTFLIIFNARRGGEPPRLLISQWEEALRGDWIDKAQDENIDDEMLITYQTGKGKHLVPVIFPPESHKGMKILCDAEVRGNSGIKANNNYIFASTHMSEAHTSGWHCINEMLVRLDMKGAINATKNRHRVATLLAKLQVSESEQAMIFQHFGHSKSVNQNVYQAAPGTLQLKSTGRLLESIRANTKTTRSKEKRVNQGEQSCSEVQVQENESEAETIDRPTINEKKDRKREYPNILPRESVDTKSRKKDSEKRENITVTKKKKLEEKNVKGKNAENITTKKYPSRKSKTIYENAYHDSDEDDDDDDVYQPETDETDEVEDAVETLNFIKEAKKYQRWDERSKQNFQQHFGTFVAQDNGYPSKASIRKFADEYGFNEKQIKIRIMNQRSERKRRAEATKKRMGMV